MLAGKRRNFPLVAVSKLLLLGPEGIPALHILPFDRSGEQPLFKRKPFRSEQRSQMPDLFRREGGIAKRVDRFERLDILLERAELVVEPPADLIQLFSGIPDAPGFAAQGSEGVFHIRYCRRKRRVATVFSLKQFQDIVASPDVVVPILLIDSELLQRDLARLPNPGENRAVFDEACPREKLFFKQRFEPLQAAEFPNLRFQLPGRAELPDAGEAAQKPDDRRRRALGVVVAHPARLHQSALDAFSQRLAALKRNLVVTARPAPEHRSVGKALDLVAAHLRALREKAPVLLVEPVEATRQQAAGRHHAGDFALELLLDAADFRDQIVRRIDLHILPVVLPQVHDGNAVVGVRTGKPGFFAEQVENVCIVLPGDRVEHINHRIRRAALTSRRLGLFVAVALHFVLRQIRENSLLVHLDRAAKTGRIDNVGRVEKWGIGKEVEIAGLFERSPLSGDVRGQLLQQVLLRQPLADPRFDLRKRIIVFALVEPPDAKLLVQFRFVGVDEVVDGGGALVDGGWRNVFADQGVDERRFAGAHLPDDRHRKALPRQLSEIEPRNLAKHLLRQSPLPGKNLLHPQERGEKVVGGVV